MMISFNPAEAAVAQSAGQLPESARAIVFDGGTIGNTSFVAIPYNAAHKEAAMVVADFLLEPSAQARAQDYRQTGALSVLDLDLLPAPERKLFDDLPKHPALPSRAELRTSLPEPHPSWMTQIATQWEQRYTK
jgi:putative thiamine transport system substrate-binding protein